MNSINIGLGTASNVRAGLASIGFTQDQTYTDRMYWANDTNGKIYFQMNDNENLYLVNSSGASIGSYYGYYFDPNVNYRIIYETIGDSIFWGYNPTTDYFNYIYFSVVEPNSNEDDWLYTFATDGYCIYNGATEVGTTTGATLLYPGVANGVQIVKYYDGLRFVDNLYMTTVCGNVPAIGSNANNYAEATINGDTYFLYKTFMTSYPNGFSSLAVKRPAAAAAST